MKIMLSSRNHLVVILQKLYNNFDLRVVVLDRNYSHDVSSIFLVWVMAVFIGQHQAGVCLSYLQANRIVLKKKSVMLVKRQNSKKA